MKALPRHALWRKRTVPDGGRLGFVDYDDMYSRKMASYEELEKINDGRDNYTTWIRSAKSIYEVGQIVSC